MYTVQCTHTHNSLTDTHGFPYSNMCTLHTHIHHAFLAKLNKFSIRTVELKHHFMGRHCSDLGERHMICSSIVVLLHCGGVVMMMRVVGMCCTICTSTMRCNDNFSSFFYNLEYSTKFPATNKRSSMIVANAF